MKYKLFILFIGLPFFAKAQVLIAESLDTLILSDSTQVVISNTEKCSQCFYYLPINLRPSLNKEGIPEVSFITWKNEEASAVIGGIFHFLTVWGLEFKQEEELQNLIHTIDSTNVLMGPITVERLADHVIIEGEDTLTTYLNKQTRRTTTATTPGAKMAMSFSFDEDEIKDVLKAMEDIENMDAKMTLGFTFDMKSNSMLIKNNYFLSMPIRNIINDIKTN